MGKLADMNIKYGIEWVAKSHDKMLQNTFFMYYREHMGSTYDKRDVSSPTMLILVKSYGKLC